MTLIRLYRYRREVGYSRVTALRMAFDTLSRSRRLEQRARALTPFVNSR